MKRSARIRPICAGEFDVKSEGRTERAGMEADFVEM